MMSNDFGADFECDVLAACLKDKKYLREAFRVLDRRHFAIHEHGWFWQIIRDSWKKNREIPAISVFRNRVITENRDEESRLRYYNLIVKLFKREPESPNTSLDELTMFVRTAKLQIAIEESVRHQEKAEWESAWNPLRELLRDDISRKSYKVSRWIEEWGERQKERKHRREHPECYKTIPTGFRELDKRIGGGIQEGELWCVLAATNRGKSMLSMNIAFNAISRGFGVIYFSTEMTEKKVAQRFDSRFSQFEYNKFKTFDFTDDDLEKLNKIVKKNKKKYKGLLRIISTPLLNCDIEMIYSAIDDMSNEMKRLDMIIIDSGDHIQQRGWHEKNYLAETANYWALKSLAEEKELIVISTTQTKVEFENKLATTGAAGGAYAKAQIADGIVSINEEEVIKRRAKITRVAKGNKSKKKAKKTNGEKIINLYAAKVRDGNARFVIPLETHLSTMLIKGKSLDED